MKNKIVGLLATTALAISLTAGCVTGLKNVIPTVPSDKVEKVEQYLKRQLLEIGPTVYGDIEKVDEIRTCLILHVNFDEKTEGMLTGVSQKGDIVYLFTGKSEIELTDYKNNGYGSVDEILIRNDNNTYKQITDPKGKQLETANNIYGLILDGYDKEVMSAKTTEEYTNSMKEYVKTNGEKLEKLIEELRSYK